MDDVSAWTALLGSLSVVAIYVAAQRRTAGEWARRALVLQEQTDRLDAEIRERRAEVSKLGEERGQLQVQIDGAKLLAQGQAQRIADLESQVASAEKRVPREKVHQVLMDGMSASGKSTLITRIVSPTLPAEKLADIVATGRAYSTRPLPVCWTQEKGEVILHNLQFWDIAGEMGSSFLNALHTIGGDGSTPTRTAVLLIVWDISDDNLGKNSIHLNPTRIEMAYGNLKAKEIISSVVVFFNKADTVDPRQLPDRIEAEIRDIRALFQSKFAGGYGTLKFFHGAALDGRGIHDCLGEILRTLGLEGGFEHIDGAGGVA